MLDSMFQEQTDKVLDDQVSRPLPAPTARPSYGASIWRTTTAAPRGIASGVNESAGFMSDIVGAFGQVQAGYGLQADPSLLFSAEDQKKRIEAGEKARAEVQSGEAFSTELGSGFRATARSFAPDPATANTVENVLYGASRFMSKAVGYSVVAGPFPGAVLTGADEGMTEADRLKQEGVDFQTRTKIGGVTGVSSAALTVMPIAGKTIKSTAGLVLAGGPGSFIAQQAANKAILQHAGYDKIADQYDPFDPVGLAVSTLVPAAFGVHGFRTNVKAAAAPAPVDAAAARQLVQMGGNERLALPFNDPRLDAYAVTAAQREGIPPAVLLAIKNHGEKSGSTAVSPAGAKGVMQFMDDTWKAYGKGDPRDPVASIDAGAKYMAALIKQYDGDVRAAIAHYNGGGKAGEAVRAGKAPPARETQKYLERTDAFLAEHAGTEAGKMAAADPEAVAAARVQQVTDMIADRGLHDPADVVGASEHVAAFERAHDQMAAGEQVDVMDAISAERLDIGRAYDAVRTLPGGDRFDPMVTIRPEDMDAVAISRGGWKGLGDMEVKGAGFGLVKFIWRHGEESGKPAEMQVTKSDLMAFPEVVRNYEPSRQAAGDGSRGREWRASLPGPDGKPRTVVFAENKVKGSDVRQVVSAYVQDPAHIDAGVPLSAKKQNPLSSAPEVGSPSAGTGQDVLLPSGRSGDAASIAEPKQGTSSPIASSVDAQAAEIAKLSLDMMVQLEGMDAPMRLADALEAVKAEAAKDAEIAPLLEVAANCFLRTS